MVKLYSLSVLHKNDMNVTWLKSAYELNSFNFFQRGCVQEFMAFVCKTVVQRTQLATRQSVKEGEYMCHVYVTINGLAGVVISDHEYPTRVAHTLLTKVLSEFSNAVPQNLWTNGNEGSIHYDQLPVYLAKYQVPKEVDAMTKIQEELDETKIILVSAVKCLEKILLCMPFMNVGQKNNGLPQLGVFYIFPNVFTLKMFMLLRQNLFFNFIGDNIILEHSDIEHDTCEAVLRRGENLDNLVAKSEELSLQAKGFYKTARKTNSCCSYM